MAKSLVLTICLLLAGVTAWAQSPPAETPANHQTAAAPPSTKDDAAAMRQEIKQLKQTLCGSDECHPMMLPVAAKPCTGGG